MSKTQGAFSDLEEVRIVFRTKDGQQYDYRFKGNDRRMDANFAVNMDYADVYSEVSLHPTAVYWTGKTTVKFELEY